VGHEGNIVGKYFGGDADVFAVMGPVGCDGLPGAYANDIVGRGCWAVTGKPVIIGDTYMSVQAGFECTNFNFRVDGTCSPVPSQGGLPGPVE
jgi:hypothetical protein